MTSSPTLSISSMLIDKANQYYLPIYRPRETVMERGSGAKLWDKSGKEYIDFAAGIAVCSLGHANPELVKVLTDQANKLWHVSNGFYSEPPILLVEKLVQLSGFAKRGFLCNSGTEANEAMIKMVRKWASVNQRAPHQRVILSFKGGFHGRTLAAITATAQAKYHEGFEPLPEGFRYCEFNDLEAVKAAIADGNVAAILIEPVQGEGGVTATTHGFLKNLRELCDAHNMLLVCDEIQCGMGRTGKLFAHHYDQIKPDIVTLAKALGGGFPIGAMLVGEKCEFAMQVGSHGTTFGGNLMAASVALKALDLLNSITLMTNVHARADQIREGLEAINAKFNVFKEYRGRGLMIGAVLADQYAGKSVDILPFAQQEGLLMLVAGESVLRFLPPLVITEDEVDAGLKALERAIAAFTASTH